jgi:hypothetical protein
MLHRNAHPAIRLNLCVCFLQYTDIQAQLYIVYVSEAQFIICQPSPLVSINVTAMVAEWIVLHLQHSDLLVVLIYSTL